MSSDEVGQAAAETTGASAELEPPTTTSESGTLARLWRWFWRTDAMRDFERITPPERVTLIHRARVAADVARRSQESAEPFVANIDAVLCDLYRQSIHWSLRALGNGTWAALDPALARRAVPDSVLAARVELATSKANFESLAQLPDQERSSLLIALRGAALALIADLEVDRRAAEAVWTQRIVRLGLVFAVLGALTFAAVKGLEGAERRHDLARGAPWRTSSVNSGVVACKSPEQECSDNPDFFFHTQEEQSPWIEFDLGSTQTISAVRVDNRRDCCMDRAAPMLVEVSVDQRHWRQVAERNATFTSWLGTFPPAEARYVRLRLSSRNSFHLQHVRILP